MGIYSFIFSDKRFQKYVGASAQCYLLRQLTQGTQGLISCSLRKRVTCRLHGAKSQTCIAVCVCMRNGQRVLPCQSVLWSVAVQSDRREADKAMTNAGNY